MLPLKTPRDPGAPRADTAGPALAPRPRRSRVGRCYHQDRGPKRPSGPPGRPARDRGEVEDYGVIWAIESELKLFFHTFPVLPAEKYVTKSVPPQPLTGDKALLVMTM
jgi:hypothetical protein